MKESYTSIDKEEKHIIFERRFFSYTAHIPERRSGSGRGSMFRIIKHGHKEGDISMASNFKIIIHQNEDDLYLNLIGDFDGSSAWELFNSLKEHSCGISRIFINTRYLNLIYPFGKRILQKNLCDFVGKYVRVIFTGEKAAELVSETRMSTGLGSDFSGMLSERVSIKEGIEATGYNN